MLVWALAAPLAGAAPLKSPDEALKSILSVMNRAATSPAQSKRSMNTALGMLDRFEREYREPAHRAVAEFLRAQCYYGLDDYPAALAAIDSARALPLDPKSVPIALYLRGRILILIGRQDEGIAAIRSVLAIAPHHEIVPEARLTLAQALADGGDGDGARAILDTVLRAGGPAWAVRAARGMMPTFRLIGRRAPDFDVAAFDGGRISLGQYRGKVVLIDFWATWCRPCRKAMPRVIRLYRRLHERGFEVIGVSLDQSPADLRAYLARTSIPWRQIMDSRAWESPLVPLFGVQGIPATFLLDKDGIVRGVDIQPGKLRGAVERLLAQP